jgi:hypothetical protein
MRNAELLNIVAWESNADFVQLIGRPDCIGTIGKSWGYVMHVVQVPTCSMYWLEIPHITVFSALYRREMPRVDLKGTGSVADIVSIQGRA